MEAFAGRVAAVTGAGSGIGRALAVRLAQDGAHLALSDVDEAGLAATVALCEGSGVKVTSARVDVADRPAVEAWADAVVADHGKANLVVNNAGVALVSTIRAMSYDDLEWLMDIDFWGVVHGTKAFLPHLEASGEGHVVNVSSVFGLISVPTQAAYNAAKFAVRGFTDTLRIERKATGSCVSATTVHPGGIKTNIVRNMRTGVGVTDNARRVESIERFDNEFAKTTTQVAAQTIIKGIENNAPRVLIGGDARFMDLLQRFRPGRYFSVLQRRIEKQRAAQAALQGK
jgi:NAD(P)-dependent dehydrogenase (short-subunit alcohol dehydrogenase family)